MRKQPYNNIGAVLKKSQQKNRKAVTAEGETGDGRVARLEREQRRADEH